MMRSIIFGVLICLFQRFYVSLACEGYQIKYIGIDNSKHIKYNVKKLFLTNDCNWSIECCGLFTASMKDSLISFQIVHGTEIWVEDNNVDFCGFINSFGFTINCGVFAPGKYCNTLGSFNINAIIPHLQALNPRPARIDLIATYNFGVNRTKTETVVTKMLLYKKGHHLGNDNNNNSGGGNHQGDDNKSHD